MSRGGSRGGYSSATTHNDDGDNSGNQTDSPAFRGNIIRGGSRGGMSRGSNNNPNNWQFPGSKIDEAEDE